ncbi:MAG: hypothetical protein AAGI07_01245 [Bacteroidota bacterium]
MKNLTAFLLLNIFFTFSTFAQVKYFSSLTGIISPYLEYKPRGVLTEKEAANKNHYRVKYRKDGRIAEIAFYKRNLPNNKAYFKTHKVVYSYQKDKIIRTYFNHNDERSVLWRHYYGGGEIHKEEFHLNANGDKSILQFYDTMGKRIATSLGAFRYEWETLSENAFIQRQWNEDKELIILTPYFPFRVAKITTDSLGHLYEIINLDAKTEKITLHHEGGYAKVVFDFDSFGNEMGWAFFDENGNAINRKLSQNMDYGYSKWIYTTRWLNKEKGLMLSFTEKYLDASGQQVTNNYGIYAIKYTRNTLGDFKSMEFYGISNKKIIHPTQGFCRLEVDYNKKGDEKEVRYYNSEGELMNNLQNGVAIQQFIYDNNRNIKEIRQFDSNNNPIKS